MIDLSLAGLLGAILGTVAAAVAYGPLVAFVERSVRSRDPSASAEEHSTLEQELPLLRRAVLAADIIVLAGLGYWLGENIGG
ncbi:MAG: hypothetical protein ACXU9C_17620 [Xanthobacteraceae bacterium]